MDQYVSWDLPSNELTLDAIWGKYEEYCKLQSNEVRARFGLLMSFHQGNCSVDKWYNAIQTQVNLARYPTEMAKILHRDIFWFFLKDEDFVSRTISDGSVDLDKFPVSRVHQLAKKYKSYIKTHKTSIWGTSSNPNQFITPPKVPITTM